MLEVIQKHLVQKIILSPWKILQTAIKKQKQQHFLGKWLNSLKNK